jgi:hypothetical protein
VPDRDALLVGLLEHTISLCREWFARQPAEVPSAAWAELRALTAT